MELTSLKFCYLMKMLLQLCNVGKEDGLVWVQMMYRTAREFKNIYSETIIIILRRPIIELIWDWPAGGLVKMHMRLVWRRPPLVPLFYCKTLWWRPITASFYRLTQVITINALVWIIVLADSYTDDNLTVAMCDMKESGNHFVF